MDKPRGAVVAGMGLQSLMDLIQGRGDEDHNKIVATVSEETNRRLNELAGNNLLARRYVQMIWRKCMDGLTKEKSNIPTDEQTTIDILRIIADTLEMRNRMHDELHKRREAETKDKPVDKDVQ